MDSVLMCYFRYQYLLFYSIYHISPFLTTNIKGSRLITLLLKHSYEPFYQRSQLIHKSYLSIMGQTNQQQMKKTTLPKGLGFILMQRLLLNEKKSQQRHLNPLSNNLFCKHWRKHIPLNLKIRQIDHQQSLTQKHAIFTWFKNLSKKQKIQVTALTNRQFILQLLHITQIQNSQARYCYEKSSSINLLTELQKNHYFDKILNHLQFACIQDPIIYFASFEPIQDIFIKWMEVVSKGKVFLDKRMAVERGSNLLWFSKYSFHSFQQILCHEFQLAIIRNYYSRSYTQIQFFQFKTYLQENQNVLCLKAININLNKLLKEQCIDLANFASLAISQMEKFKQQKQMKMLDQLLYEPEVNKISKKQGKRKRKNAKDIKLLKSDFPSQFAMMQIEKYANQTQKGLKQTLTTQQELAFNEKFTQKQLNSNNNTQLYEEKIGEKDVKIIDKSNQISEVAHSHYQSHLNLSFEDSYHSSLTKNFIQIMPKKTFSPQNLRSSLPMSSEFFDYLHLSEKKISSGKQEGEQNKSTITKRNKRRCRKENEATISAHKMIYNRLISRETQTLARQIIFQSNQQHSYKELIFERVKIFIKGLFPYCEAILFGSSSIGLSLASSDIDIQLVNIPCKDKTEAGKILSYIQAEIAKMSWITQSQAHTHAKAPVLKICTRPQVSFLSTKNNYDIKFQIYDSQLISSLNRIPVYLGQNINVDITILVNGVTSIGLQTTSYMKEYIHKYPQMKNIYLILKYLLSGKGLSSNYRGGIGSFYLFIMVAAYFKQYYQENIPQFQLFSAILRFYSQKFTSKLIQLKENEPYFIQYLKDPLQNAVSMIKLRNPLNDEIMISSCFKQQQIREQFSRVYHILEQWQTNLFQRLQKDVKTSTQLLKKLQSKRYIDRYLKINEQNARYNLKEAIDSSKIIIS